MSGSPQCFIKMQSTVFLLVVLLKCVQSVDQSPIVIPEARPISIVEGKGRTDTPEVVLQLKYDGGELDRVYFTQFRKPSGNRGPVAIKIPMCTDLCHAGLGGASCGPTCPALLPLELHFALADVNDTEIGYGRPRYDVCPILCENTLGNPLCSCATSQLEDPDHEVDWKGICTAFCADGYGLPGCPICASVPSTAIPVVQSSRILDTLDGWTAWCNMQCRQGTGGAACNCDRPPL